MTLQEIEYKIQELFKKRLEEGGLSRMPVNDVIWIPVDMVMANNYNPNKVAIKEMQLLALSMLADGITQPVVTIYDSEIKKFVIVDGFHRYFTIKTSKEINALTFNNVPLVVINRPVNDLMASTIRHNRARGKHSITGVANIVFKMLDGGWSDEKICTELGMEASELVRLKHITGFSKVFKDVEYNKAWKTRKQIALQAKYHKKRKV